MQILFKENQTVPSESNIIYSNGEETIRAANGNCGTGEHAGMLGTMSFPHKERRNLSAQILMIQEAERQRIAKDLHDGLGQSLTLISLGLEECATLIDEHTSSDARASLERQRLKVQAAFAELRRIAMDLRPPMIDDLGILATMSWYFREFGNTCQRIEIVKKISVEERQIPAAIKISIFRILQESFSNILKHAKANQICVNFSEQNGTLALLIEDNGRGFNPFENGDYFPASNGLGLISMRERANLSGGIYRIESSIGKGTRIHVSWPSCIAA